MPKYNKDMQTVISPEDIQAMINRCHLMRHKTLLMMLYLTGCRPGEVVKIEKKDITEDIDTVRIALTTEKHGYPRKLTFNKNTIFIEDLLSWIKVAPDGILWDISPDRIRQIVYETSDNKYTTYNFRHSRLYQLADAGATIFELAGFKGSRTLDSVMPYAVKAGITNRHLKDSIK